VKTERLKNSIGKKIKLWLEYGYVYNGKITNCDNFSLEIIDNKTGFIRVFKITQITDFTILEPEVVT